MTQSVQYCTMSIIARRYGPLTAANLYCPLVYRKIMSDSGSEGLAYARDRGRIWTAHFSKMWQGRPNMAKLADCELHHVGWPCRKKLEISFSNLPLAAQKCLVFGSLLWIHSEFSCQISTDASSQLQLSCNIFFKKNPRLISSTVCWSGVGQKRPNPSVRISGKDGKGGKLAGS